MDLVSLVHEIPFGTPWETLVDRLVDLLGIFSADVLVLDHTRGDSRIYGSRSMDPELHGAYAAHYGRLDPFVPLASTRSLGEWCPRPDCPISPGRGPRGWREDDRDAERLCRMLAPHLSRAAKTQRILTEAESQRLAAIEALDRIEIGVVLLNGVGRVMSANRASEEISAAGDGFALSREGPSADRARDADRLRGFIRDAVGTTQRRGTLPGGAMRLRRRSGRRAYEVLVTPIASHRLALGSGHAAALLFVTDPERTPRSLSEHVAELYELTPVEAELAMRLMTGASPAQIADERGVSVHTVRAQLKSLLAKTDTRRQSELVRLLYRSVSAIASRD